MLTKIKTRFKVRKSKSILSNPFEAQKLFFHDYDDIIIFDVGAYIGETTKIYSAIFPQAVIYSFEPFPDSFQKLSQLSHDRSIKPYQIAISDKVGKTKFHINTDLTCNSFFPRPGKGKKYYAERAENIKVTEVKTITVEQFCNTKGISKIDILKLDVEGAELKVLEGAHSKLSEHAISLVYTEVMFVPHYEGGCMFHELSSFLGEYGYTLLNLYNLKSAPNGQLRWGNAIFLSPQLRTKFEDSKIV